MKKGSEGKKSKKEKRKELKERRKRRRKQSKQPLDKSQILTRGVGRIERRIRGQR